MDPRLRGDDKLRFMQQRHEELKKQLPIGVVKKGAVLGEVSLIDNALTSASVRTLKPTSLYVFSFSKLKSLNNPAKSLTKVFKLPYLNRLTSPELSIYPTIVQNIAMTYTRAISRGALKYVWHYI